MKTILTACIAALPVALCAQTNHRVEVGGSSLGSTRPYYAPNLLNIHVGDTVTWRNVSGTHNVNGSTAFFPPNPEGFSSGNPSSSAWTFSRVFTIAGAYNYMCTTEGHSATQTGRIIVLDGSSVPESTGERPFSLSPTPATDHISVETGDRTISHFEVVGMDGRLMANHAGNTGRLARISVTTLPQGNYLLRVIETSGRSTTLRFSKD